ncbi:sensor domain-containing protein [Comamonas endophytica]|uniref:EAL domain-containing protein n=1 Tax=Comamonas endophytica TaxID=2949090 RepID=A0ABY6GAG4_9BURK|nr:MULTISPECIES: EAL domain-containing protein [unclassified Acidovorax]MCD2513958.1 EAL domain-containing protein [Acidovorax sp. D4N7]UYG52049.1 EAL domain-containing protein [Acidovorax sp. 5MLIR]
MNQPLQALWHQTLDALLEAVWLIDEDTLCIRFANRAAQRLTAYDREDMQGMPVQALAATPQDLCLWEDASQWRNGSQTLTQVQCRDGTLRPVEQRVERIDCPLGGENGWIMLSMLDRSEQAHTEQELEGLLSDLRATLDSTADGMLVCSQDGGIRAFNHRLAAIWGLPQHMLVQRNDAGILEYMAAKVRDRQAYLLRLEQLQRQPLLESTDVLELESGHIIERRSVPQLKRGAPIGRIHSFRDITHEVEVQAGLKLAARVFDCSLDAIFIADAAHRLVRANPACLRLMGEGDWAGRDVRELFGSSAPADWYAAAAQEWRGGGFWQGNLWLEQGGQQRCAVRLSWVALRDAQDMVFQTIGFMRDLTQQRQAQQRIEELAFSDALTGLPNRLCLSAHVERALARAADGHEVFAILFIDLDRFKIINDSLGHQFGDRVLKLVAERLQGCLRAADMLCRLGGDEFVLYLEGCDETLAASVAQRILREMLRPFLLDGLGFSVQCSIGVSQYPHHGHTLDELIMQADTAMYRVKERGRGHYSFYQPQMNSGLLSRMKLEHAMRQALEHGRMAVYFQPQVHIGSNRIVGAEALLRWNDPEFGMVSPGVFIPMAEESGYIVTLGAWVLEQSICEAVRWSVGGRPLKVSVNVSALEFRQPDFVERLQQLLSRHGLQAHLLELELTESILLQDAHEMAARVRSIAELGVGLVIDDFGTGYSSLGYLKKLPIAKIKIDQSFVRGLPQDPGDRAIVSAIISMGKALGTEVVAEGVETSAQRDCLQSLQCQFFQGFLCSPGLPAEAFDARMREMGVLQEDDWHCGVVADSALRLQSGSPERQ